MIPATLTPRLFEPDWTFDEGFCDVEGMGGRYAISGPEGATFYHGSRTGEKGVVHLEAGLTLPEEAARLGASSRQAEVELQAFTTVLNVLGWPLRPKMPFAEAWEACLQLFPRVICSKSQPVDCPELKEPVTRRDLAALAGTTLIVMDFRDDCLWSMELKDLSLVAANDDMEGVGKALHDVVRRRLMAEVAADPVTAAREHLHLIFTRENTERAHNFPLITEASPEPAEEPVQEVARSISEEAAEITDMPILLLPPELAGTPVHELQPDDRQRGLDNATLLRMRRVLTRRHGSLADMIWDVKDDFLLDHLDCWFGRSQTSVHPQAPDITRMITCLVTLNREVSRDGGLECWLTLHLEDAWDTMATLLALGEHDLITFFCELDEKARAEGFDPTDSQSWKQFFKKDPCKAEEQAVMPLIQSLPRSLRAWLLAHDPQVTAEDAAVEARLAAMAGRSPEEVNSGLRAA